MFGKNKAIINSVTILFLLILILCALYGFHGHNNKMNNSFDRGENYTEYDKSIQMELEVVEEEYANLSNKDSDKMSQFEMNEWAAERFTLWDNELNSLLDRLSDELDDETKTKILQEQKQWNDKRSANIFVAGLGWGKGSSQPCITYGAAEEMTYARVYVLARYLAEVRGESFQIPKNVKDNLKNKYPSRDDVFKMMRGRWSLEPNKSHMISIAPVTEYTESSADGIKWLISDEQGYVMSDKDVYGYSYSDIVFEVNREGKDIYYWLSYDDLYIRYCQADSLEALYEAEAQLLKKRV